MFQSPPLDWPGSFFEDDDEDDVSGSLDGSKGVVFGIVVVVVSLVDDEGLSPPSVVVTASTL